MTADEVRDAAANNLAEVLDFTSAPDLRAPRYTVPDIVPAGCADLDHAHYGDDWAHLAAYAKANNFPV